MKVSPHREAIVRLHQSGMKPLAIVSKLKVSKTLVYDILKRWKQTKDIKEKPKVGRPRTVNTRRTRGIIKKRIERNDGVSLNRMAKALEISRKSVQMIVRNELGLKSYRLHQGQFLIDQAKKNRIERCKKLRAFFGVRRHENVLWSDEKVFTVEPAKNSQNHRQLPSPAQGKSQRRKVVTKMLYPKSVMVWGGIGAHGKTPLVFIPKNVKIDAVTYQKDILEKFVLP